MFHPCSHRTACKRSFFKPLCINKRPHLLFFTTIPTLFFHFLFFFFIFFFSTRSHQCIYRLFLHRHSPSSTRLRRHHFRIQALRDMKHRATPRLPSTPTKRPSTTLLQLLSLDDSLRVEQRGGQRRGQRSRGGRGISGGIAGHYDVRSDVTLRTTLQSTFPSESELRERGERGESTSASVRGVWKNGVSGVGLI